MIIGKNDAVLDQLVILNAELGEAAIHIGDRILEAADDLGDEIEEGSLLLSATIENQMRDLHKNLAVLEKQSADTNKVLNEILSVLVEIRRK